MAMLSRAELAEAYAEAFAEWDLSPDAPLWESVEGDAVGFQAS